MRTKSAACRQKKGGARSVPLSRVGPPGQGCILIRSRDIGWLDALDLFWVPIGTMGALGKLKMKYMHQVRSLSTKRRATIAPMGATGEPEMNYAHQVRSLSTKKGGGPDSCRNHVFIPGGRDVY